MGGCQGHMVHPYEDTSLTLSELSELFTATHFNTSKNNFRCEKFDGINLIFKYNGHDLVFARSHTDLRSGGLKIDQLSNRFKDQPEIGIVMESAMQSLSLAFETVRDKTKFMDYWRSLDVLSKEQANVIHYDIDAIAIHPVYLNDSGELFPMIDETISFEGQWGEWLIIGPRKLGSLGSNESVMKAINAISSLPYVLNTKSENVSLADIYRHKIELLALDAQIPMDLVGKVAKRILKEDGYQNLTELKKLVRYSSDIPILQAFVKDERNVLKKARFEVEEIVHSFSVQMMSDVESVLISDSQAEISRLREKMVDTFNKFCGSDHDEFIRLQFRRLGQLTNINSSIEGIVVYYEKKNTFYKFTGWFAPTGQALGVERYGR